MTEYSLGDSAFSQSTEGEAEGYRRICPWAVLAVGFGLASALATLSSLLLCLPVAGVIAAIVALRLIHTDKTFSGRKIALVGLALSILFLVAVPVWKVSRRQQVVTLAQSASIEWLDLLRKGRLEGGHLDIHDLAKAFEIAHYPAEKRQDVDTKLVDYYLRDDVRRTELEGFANEPLVRTMMALGQRARVRHYETESVRSKLGKDTVTEVSVVTFMRNDKLEAFFVKMTLERLSGAGSQYGNWRVEKYDGGYSPKSRAK